MVLAFPKYVILNRTPGSGVVLGEAVGVGVAEGDGVGVGVADGVGVGLGVGPGFGVQTGSRSCEVRIINVAPKRIPVSKSFHPPKVYPAFTSVFAPSTVTVAPEGYGLFKSVGGVPESLPVLKYVTE